MEVMRVSGITEKIAKLLQPLLSLIMPKCHDDPAIMTPACANVASNLLGLGNAATPLGIKTVCAMVNAFGSSAATNDMCMFIILNTASIQLLPTTVAAIRSAAGAQAPFDILPAVWLTSFASVTVGILSGKLMSKIFK
jgi:spore maturation protein A